MLNFIYIKFNNTIKSLILFPIKCYTIFYTKFNFLMHFPTLSPSLSTNVFQLYLISFIGKVAVNWRHKDACPTAEVHLKLDSLWHYCLIDKGLGVWKCGVNRERETWINLSLSFHFIRKWVKLKPLLSIIKANPCLMPVLCHTHHRQERGRGRGRGRGS